MVYKIPKNNKIIDELIFLFKNTNKKNMNLKEIDDSNKISVISTSIAIASLEIICTFLL